MNNKFKIALFTILITIIFSCNDENIDISELNLKERAELNVENSLFHDFAKILAESMNNENGRSFIKKEALREFDGDFDILFVEVKDKEMGMTETSLKRVNSNTFVSFLNDSYASESKLKSSIDFNKFINTLVDKYPLFQISIPEIFEGSTKNWDELNELPLIAVLPDNFDENTTKVITAYDHKGNVSYLDINNCPEKPVIVLSQNERLIAIRKDNITNKKSQKIQDDCLEFYYETNEYEYYLPADCGDGGSIGGGNGGSTITFDRDNNDNRDVLNKAKFVSKSTFRQVEPWPTGRPEFKVVITYIEKEGSSYNTKTITKILSKSSWMDRYVFWVNLKTKQIDLPILTWDKEIIGNSMKYTWIEQDNSDTKVELSIAVSTKYGENNETTITGNTKVTISAKDDEAGEAVVEYKDITVGEGTEYNTGILKFWVNQ